ncbi:MAG: S8 family serine peptidase, partial [Mycobacteriales bacterium]
DTGYVTESGTSFGAPFVAGYAAALLEAARGAGRSLTADALETLVKYSATDTSTPPTFEGYGVVSLAGLAAAREHARAATLPGRPSPDLSGTYVESVSGRMRSAWSD